MPIRKDDEVVVTRGHYKGQPAAKVTAVRAREGSAINRDRVIRLYLCRCTGRNGWCILTGYRERRLMVLLYQLEFTPAR